MAHFKDTKGDEWEVKIDAPMILRIREECDPGFMLGDGEKENTYGRLSTDPVLLCRIIFLLCDKQRQTRSISEEQFYEHVIGDAIDGATEAMLQAIINFTPRRTRDLLKASAAKQESLHSLAMKAAIAKINDPELEKEIVSKLKTKLDNDIEQILTGLGSVSNTQDSSESTQAG